MTGTDLRVMARAIRDGQFVLSDRALVEVPEAMAYIALDLGNPARARVMAAKVLVEMNKANLEARKLGTARRVDVNVSGGVAHLHLADLAALTNEELQAAIDRAAAALPPPSGSGVSPETPEQASER